jgi:hypothetical protein
MSYVVRHKNTGHYLQGHDQWTTHLGSALQFNSGMKLVHYIERGGLRVTADTLEILVIPGQTPAPSGSISP